MRFGKSIGGGWIMPQMCIDRIAPAIGGGDFGAGAIDLADALLGGRDRTDRAIVRRPERPAPADIAIVRASVGRLADQLLAVITSLGATPPRRTPARPPPHAPLPTSPPPRPPAP